MLEAFTAGIARCEEGEAKELLQDVCTLFALSTIEDDLAWFMGHNRLSIPRAKEVTQLVNAQCEKLRPHTEALVEGFGVAWGAIFLGETISHGMLIGGGLVIAGTVLVLRN